MKDEGYQQANSGWNIAKNARACVVLSVCLLSVPQSPHNAPSCLSPSSTHIFDAVKENDIKPKINSVFLPSGGLSFIPTETLEIPQRDIVR